MEDKVVKIKGTGRPQGRGRDQVHPSGHRGRSRPRPGLEPLALSVDGDRLPSTVIDDLKGILARFPGQCSVDMYVRTERRSPAPALRRRLPGRSAGQPLRRAEGAAGRGLRVPGHSAERRRTGAAAPTELLASRWRPRGRPLCGTLGVVTGREVAEVVAAPAGRRARPRATPRWWRPPPGSTGPGVSASRTGRAGRGSRGRLPRGRPGASSRRCETARDNCTFFHRHELVPDWEDDGSSGAEAGHPPSARGARRPLRARRPGLLRLHGDHERRARPGGRSGGAGHLHAPGAGRERSTSRCWPRPGSWASSGCSAWAGRRPSRPWPTARRPSPGWTSSAGPGNAYVMEAKRQVYGSGGHRQPGRAQRGARGGRPDGPTGLGRRRPAGPGGARQRGPGRAGGRVGRAVCRQVAGRRREPARGDAWRAGRDGRTEDHRRPTIPGLWAFYPAPGEDFLGLAAAVVNAYAPEHLELQLADRARLPAPGALGRGGLRRPPHPHGLRRLRGRQQPRAAHRGSARFSSPLSVDTFMRRSSYVEMTAEAVRLLTPHLAASGRQRGLRLPPRLGRTAGRR